MNRRKICALLPRFSSKLGHIFHYHLSAKNAAHSIGWDYLVFIPQKTSIADLPNDWEKVLANDLSDTPKNFFLKIKILIQNLSPFYKILKKLEKDPNAILFLEHFEFPHLASLFFTLLILKPRFQFWLLHRYPLNSRGIKSFFLKHFHRYLHKKFGQNLKLLTDSEPLSFLLEKVLSKPISVVPIPHTEGCIDQSKKSSNSPLLWWWPGGLIREDKGLFKIQYLLSQLSQNTLLVMAEKAKPIFNTTKQISFIPTTLSRTEYITWMKTADLILLPYSSKDYAHRTSGIFVEAVSAGAIPVVTKGTWMAYELAKFDLDELCFFWDEPTLIHSLEILPSNPQILRKLRKMCDSYRMFHSEQGFALALDRISSSTDLFK